MLKRFINPRTGRPFADDPVPQTAKVSNLNQYFISVGNKFKEVQQEEGEDGMEVITPPELKN